MSRFIPITIIESGTWELDEMPGEMGITCPGHIYWLYILRIGMPMGREGLAHWTGGQLPPQAALPSLIEGPIGSLVM